MLKLKLQYFAHLKQRTNALGKASDAGKDWRHEEKGAREDEMIGWHHWLDGHEFEQTVGDSEGQGTLACCSPWGRRVRHNRVTEQQQSFVALELNYMFFHVLDPHTSHVLILVLILKVLITGTSLIVQTLRLYASSAEGEGSICSCGTKIQHAVRHS